MFAVDVSHVLSYAENRSVDVYAQKLFKRKHYPFWHQFNQKQVSYWPAQYCCDYGCCDCYRYLLVRVVVSPPGYRWLSPGR